MTAAELIVELAKEIAENGDYEVWPMLVDVDGDSYDCSIAEVLFPRQHARFAQPHIELRLASETDLISFEASDGHR